ncbi:hypothetical protein RPMA_01435 [Tardiphaga alba]|uniref:DUF2786 domain-containing protein n=1 Tax=Tardiphaga alba TaxID=340268 RepID=A0ABX8A2E4_9BRAD|nr:hypothetical protein [Tardiphaga alba]QUS37674.1 hypothetical protein RPMA_01435 [Tardiphaga alba]
MQNTAAMNSDVKALLTLLALKTGTSSPEIHHALQLAAASRVMMAEEHANPARGTADATASNVARLRPSANNVPETSASVRRMKQSAEAMNSDIKALITLMLLKNGADANEIQTALRMAAGSRAAAAAEEAEALRADNLHSDDNPEMVAELASLAGGRQASRGEKEFAA